MCTICMPGAQRSSLELKLQTIVSGQVGAGKQTQVLRKEQPVLTAEPSPQPLTPPPQHSKHIECLSHLTHLSVVGTGVALTF